MNTLTYADFSEKVHSNTSGKRIPLDASIDLTYRCNNKCVHCYCNLPEKDGQAIKEELSTIEVKKLLDDLASMGSLWLLITGGEPLLREDFEEIYLYAKKKGFLITLFTNGTLVDEKTVELLSKYPPFVAEISLYGATKKTYEKVTRVKGSYERCMSGIRKIVGSGIKVKLKTMVLTINQHEIEAMDRIARKLGCEFRFDPMLNKRIDDNTYSDPVKYRISPEEVVRLDKAYPKRMEEWKRFCDKFVGEPIRDDRLYKCGAGLTTSHIDPCGNLSICSMASKEVYNLRCGNFIEGWYDFIGSMREKAPGMESKCRTCNLAFLCGQCPGWSQVEHGDDESPVDFLCTIAHKRAETFAGAPPQ
jgi:radical SAM protein with 4Fe4S-binding SPASM domain